MIELDFFMTELQRSDCKLYGRILDLGSSFPKDFPHLFYSNIIFQEYIAVDKDSWLYVKERLSFCLRDQFPCLNQEQILSLIGPCKEFDIGEFHRALMFYFFANYKNKCVPPLERIENKITSKFDTFITSYIEEIKDEEFISFDLILASKALSHIENSKIKMNCISTLYDKLNPKGLLFLKLNVRGLEGITESRAPSLFDEGEISEIKSLFKTGFKSNKIMENGIEFQCIIAQKE